MGVHRRLHYGSPGDDLKGLRIEELTAGLAAELAQHPGQTASELASRLGGLEERGVEFALLSNHGCFRAERGRPRRWRLAGTPDVARRRAPSAVAPRPGSDLPDRVHPARVSPQPPVRRDRLGLYRWQAEALGAWARAGRRGVVEAVTGTGKTMLGVAAALAELDRRGQVVVLVPTVELAHQWTAELAARLPPAARLGRLGANRRDTLATHDVVVAVINSARALDLRPIRQGGLLVADECHRYGSAVNHLALDARFRRRLGLSATYAREDEGNTAWLDPYFGSTCFRLDFARARAEGVIARFRVVLQGVSFSPAEQSLYTELSERMGALRAQLVGRYGLPGEPFWAFMGAVNLLADAGIGPERLGGGEGGGVARAWRQIMFERRRLLADTPAKDAAIGTLAPAVADSDRAIVFTQSVSASERAESVLSAAGLRCGVVHSGLALDERRSVLARFGAGQLQVLAAPRVLDEGIDVPSADLAVIAGASRSRRQMIQRMGRVLRRKPDGRRARLAVLFVEGTVEDPAQGAHEGFLDELDEVADELSYFSAGSGDWSEAAGGAGGSGPDLDGSRLRKALKPSWPGAVPDVSPGGPGPVRDRPWTKNHDRD